MTVTVASLRTAYPEHDNTPEAMITSAITRARNRVDSEVLGDRYDDCVTEWACHLILQSPHGLDMRYESDKNVSPHLEEAKRLMMAAGTAWRMIS